MSRLALVLVALIAACGDPDPNMPIDAASPDAAHDAAVPTRMIAYASGYGPNIAWYDVDKATGAWTPISSVAAFAASPSFLAITGSHLYAASEGASRIGAYAIDRATGNPTFINDVASAGSGPAHVSVDPTGKFVLAANYGNGIVAVLPVRGDGGLGAATQMPNAGVNAHQILTAPGNRHVLVPCKGSDYVAQYTFDPSTGALGANGHAAVAGGPRHLAFAPDGAHAYLINENASTLVALAFDGSTGQLSTLQTLSTRAGGATGTNTGAEVAVHPSGKWVYGSNRGDNNIAVFAIAAATGMVSLVGNTPTGGMTPRMFAIDPTGGHLYVANQNSNTIVTFAIDQTTGALNLVGSPLTVTGPSYIGFLELPL